MSTLNTTFARYADRKVPRYTSYPTAPHFHDGVGPTEARSWLGRLSRQETISVYLHVPFCATLCSYCGCHTKITKRYQPVAAYAGYLDKEITLLADQLPERLRVSHVHWGGGTPTLLEQDDFLRLMGRLRERFDFAETAEIAIEGDPRTLDGKSLDMLVEGGINRISFGVQAFNAHVQEAIGRPQSFELTRDVTERCRAAGISGINFDLMYGLPKQTLDDVVNSMRLTNEIRPQRIALFGYAHVPWFKKHQTLIKEKDLPDQSLRFEQTEAAAAELVKLGYVRIGLDHFALPDDELAIAQREGRLRRNFQGYTTDAAAAMLPVGCSSIGFTPQGYMQNLVDIGGWKARIDAGEPAVARGLVFSAEDIMRADIIEQLMCNLFVDLEQIAARHGRSPDHFGEELAALDELARDNLVRREGLKITIPEENRAFMRIAAAVFDTYLRSENQRHSVAV